MLAMMEAKTDITLKEMREEMLARVEVMIEDNHEKFEILQGTLVSRINVNQEEIKSAVNALQENMDA
jgi:hypothetical protein